MMFRITGMATLLALLDARAACAAPRTESNRRGHGRPRPDRDAEQPYRFFDKDEAAFIEAAVGRLIPADGTGPGARHAGVAVFIDRQMTGGWDAGSRQYRRSLWHAGQQHDGDRLPPTPGEMFRSALRGIESDLQEQAGHAFPVGFEPTHSGPVGRLQGAGFMQSAAVRRPASLPQAIALTRFAPHAAGYESARRRFARASSEEQDRYLKALQSGHANLDGVPSQLFFEILFGLTIEGFFSDPVNTGNEDCIASASEAPHPKTERQPASPAPTAELRGAAVG
jgi:gluconate 2-dehydrogenase gamma chain